MGTTSGNNGACWRCVYFDTENRDDYDAGFCRRYPPTPIDEYTVVWAGVDSIDWCGEFKEQGNG